MTGEKVVLFGGPMDGLVVDDDDAVDATEIDFAQLEVRPDGRRWTIYRYCARTGNYLGTKP